MELPLRTPLERVMPIPHILEEMRLLLPRGQRGRDGMHGRVAPPLVVEPAVRVEVLEERGVGGGAPEGLVGYFEVGPDWCGESKLV